MESVIIRHQPCGPYEKYIKRPLDCVLASAALIVLSPVLGVTALLIRRKLGSPVIFCQERPGKDGKIFRLYKFRSMSDAKDENGDLLSDDERLTDFGKKLRSTSLDELPELWNIVRGDMAIVGPRPLLIEYLPYYTEDEMRRHDVRPGLTGLAQVHGRNAISWDTKLAYDVRYVDGISFLGDVSIVLLTIKKTLARADILVGSQHKFGRLDVERAGKHSD